MILVLKDNYKIIIVRCTTLWPPEPNTLINHKQPGSSKSCHTPIRTRKTSLILHKNLSSKDANPPKISPLPNQNRKTRCSAKIKNHNFKLSVWAKLSQELTSVYHSIMNHCITVHNTQNSWESKIAPKTWN